MREGGGQMRVEGEAPAHFPGTRQEVLVVG